MCKQRQDWKSTYSDNAKGVRTKKKITSSSSMVFAARKKQLIAIQFRYFGRA